MLKNIYLKTNVKPVNQLIRYTLLFLTLPTKAPMNKSTIAVVILYALLPLTFWGQNPQDIIVNISPSDLSFCNDETVITVNVTNNSAVALTNLTFTYQLDLGLSYESGSLVGEGIIAIDNNPNAPVFQLEDLSSGARQSFELTLNTACTEDRINNEMLLAFNGNQASYDQFFTIRKPVLVLTNELNGDYRGVVGETFQRTYTVRNTGFGSINQFVINNEHASSIEVLSVSLGNLNIIPTGTSVTIDESILTNVGNGNTSFDRNESISITETVLIKACSFSEAFISASPVCETQVCEAVTAGSIRAFVRVSQRSPDISFGLVDGYDYPSLCTAGQLSVLIRNEDTQQDLFDIVAELGMLGKDFSARFPCYPLSGFEISGTSLSTTTNADEGYDLVLTQLTSDPDGANNGLADLDNDGIYDDLPAGESIRIDLNIEIDESCKNGCNSSLQTQFLSTNLSYSDACGNDRTSSTAYDTTFVIGVSELEVDDVINVEYSDESLTYARFIFSGQINNLIEICDDPVFIYKIELPANTIYAAGQLPTFNGRSVNDYILTGNLLTIEATSPTGTISVPFIGVCPDLSNLSAECEVPFINNFRYSMEYQCASDGCDDFIQLYCGNSPPFLINCSGEGEESVSSDISMPFFEARRVTLGWTDSTQTQNVSPDATGLRLQRAMSKDIVELEVQGTVNATIDFDSLFLRVYYFNNLVVPYLDYVTDTLKIYDNESGTWFTCTNTGVLATYQDEFHQFIVHLNPLLNNNACFSNISLTAGDRIEYILRTRVRSNVPQDIFRLPGLKANFYSTASESSLKCSRRDASFEVFNPRYELSTSDSNSSSGCDTMQLSFVFSQGGEDAAFRDPFPNEFRPYAGLEDIGFRLPSILEYLPQSARLVADKAHGQAVIPLPEPSFQNDGDFYNLIFEDLNLIIDYIGAYTDIRLDIAVLPLCLSNRIENWSGLLVGDQYIQTEDLGEQERIENSLLDDLNYRLGTYRIRTFPQTFFGERDTAEWTLELCNALLDDKFSYDLEHNWMAFELPPNVTLLQLVDEDTGITLAYQQYDSLKYWVKLDQIAAGTCRVVRLKAGIDACENGKIDVFANSSCEGYPVSPDDFTYPNNACSVSAASNELFIEPRDAALQAVLTPLSNNAPTLCESVSYELLVINTLISKASNLRIEIDLPPGEGIALLDNSSQLILDSRRINLPDPDFDPERQTYYWDLESIEAGAGDLFGAIVGLRSEVKIQFDLSTNCNFLDRSTVAYQVHWTEVCGKAASSPKYISSPIVLRDAPDQFNNYDLAVRESTLLTCENHPNTITIRAENLGGAADNVSALAEKVRLILDTSFQYMPASFVNLHNIPNEDLPQIQILEDVQVWEWDIPAGIAAGDSIVFQIDIASANAAALACDSSIAIALQVVESINVFCAQSNESCPVAFVTNEAPFTFRIQKPNYDIALQSATSLPFSDRSEWFTAQYRINSEPALATTDQIRLQFYHDADGDSNLDFGIDSLLYSEDILADLSQNSSLQSSFELASQDACNQIFAVFSNACTCEPIVLKIDGIDLKNAGIPDTICAGESIVLGTNPVPFYRYQWRGSEHLNDNTIANPIYQNTSDSAPNFSTETLILATTRPMGCTSFDTLEISSVRLDLSLRQASNYNGQAISCYGASDGAIDGIHEGGFAPYTYATNGRLLDTTYIDGLAAGTYYLTLSDATGCQAVDSIRLESPDSLALSTILSDYNGYNLSCYQSGDGEIITTALGGTGDLSFLWDNGSEQARQTQLAAGEYALSITDANGCRLQADYQLTEPDSIRYQLSTEQPLCLNGSNGRIEISLAGGVMPYSDGVDTFNTAFVLDQLTQGAYVLNISDANACLALQDTIELAEIVSTFELEQNPVQCFGGANGEASIQAISGFAPYRYLWSNGVTTANNPSLVAGTYQLEVQDANNCVYAYEAIITEPPLLAVALVDEAVRCFGESNGAIQSLASGGVPPYNYQWSNDSINETITALPAGNYQLTLTDANACRTTASISVTQPQALIATLQGTDITCFGGDDGSIIAEVNGGTSPYGYTWRAETGTDTLQRLAAGNYQLTVNDDNQCTTAVDITLTQPDSITFETAIQIPSCYNYRDAILSVFAFSEEDLQYSLNNNWYSEESVFTNLAAGDYNFYIRNANNCVYDYDLRIDNPPELIIDLPTTYRIALGDSVQLSSQINTNEDVIYEWTFDESLSCLVCYAPTVSPLENTYYQVLAETDKGCVASATTLVSIDKRGLVYRPNIFSPNDDDNNDFFIPIPKASAVRQIHFFQVYDRWGGLMYERTNISNTPDIERDGWNGIITRKGQAAPIGTYAWKIQVEYIDGRQEVLQGDVTLVR